MFHKSFSRAALLTATVCLLFVGCDKATDLLPKKKSNDVSQEFNKVPKKQEAVASKATVKKKNQPLSDDELVRIGDWRMSIDEFNERMDLVSQTIENFDSSDENTKALVLEEIVRQQLLVQEAQQLNVHKKKEIALAVEDFRRTLLVQEMVDRIASNVTASEQEAFEYFNANPNLFIEPLEVRLREIVSLTQEEAKKILVQILQGADFAQVARSQSQGTTAQEGGDLGFLIEAPFEQMAAAVAPLSVGDVSSVFKGPEGYYIVKLEEKRGGVPIAYEDIKEDLVQGLTVQKKQQAVLNRLTQIAETTEVEINQDLLLNP